MNFTLSFTKIFSIILKQLVSLNTVILLYNLHSETKFIKSASIFNKVPFIFLCLNTRRDKTNITHALSNTVPHHFTSFPSIPSKKNTTYKGF